MAELTLKDFAEKLSSLVNTDENVAALTFPIDFQDVSAETLLKVNEYEGYLANNDYASAAKCRKDNPALESLILDATKLNYLQTLMLTSYEFAKGEKSAETTSYDGSASGLDATNVQDAIDSICEDIGINGGEGSISDKIENLENSHSNMSNSIDEINDTLITKLPFGFGIDENGNYGYIKDGADTVTPFSEIYKESIINILPERLGLTEDSTWDDVIKALNTLFPEQFNLIAETSRSDWTVTPTSNTTYSKFSVGTNQITATVGKSSSGRKGYVHAISPQINLSAFSNLSIKWSTGSKGSERVTLEHDNGSLTLGKNNTHNISKLTGYGYIDIKLESEWGAYYEGELIGDGYYPGSITITKLLFTE